MPRLPLRAPLRGDHSRGPRRYDGSRRFRLLRLPRLLLTGSIAMTDAVSHPESQTISGFVLPFRLEKKTLTARNSLKERPWSGSHTCCNRCKVFRVLSCFL